MATGHYNIINCGRDLGMTNIIQQGRFNLTVHLNVTGQYVVVIVSVSAHYILQR
jgi:hypothetical protein